MGVGQDGKAYLTGHHEHGEDKDETGFGHWEPAGLLEGEEYSSIQAGLGGAGGDSYGYREAWLGPGLCTSVPDLLLCLPPASPSPCWLPSVKWEDSHMAWRKWCLFV